VQSTFGQSVGKTREIAGLANLDQMFVVAEVGASRANFAIPDHINQEMTSSHVAWDACSLRLTASGQNISTFAPSLGTTRSS
jgi:hypothetical protein